MREQVAITIFASRKCRKEFCYALPKVHRQTQNRTSRAPTEQARGPDQQYDGHDDEDHGVGRFGKEHFGEALDDAQQNGKQVVVQVSSPKDNATEVLKLCFVTTKTTNEKKTDSLAS